MGTGLIKFLLKCDKNLFVSCFYILPYCIIQCKVNTGGISGGGGQLMFFFFIPCGNICFSAPIIQIWNRSSKQNGSITEMPLFVSYILYNTIY